MCRTQVDSLIQRKLEPDICLEEEVNRNWSEILFQLYRFDRLVKEVRLLGVWSLYVCMQWRSLLFVNMFVVKCVTHRRGWNLFVWDVNCVFCVCRWKC